MLDKHKQIEIDTTDSSIKVAGEAAKAVAKINIEIKIKIERERVPKKMSMIS